MRILLSFLLAIAILSGPANAGGGGRVKVSGQLADGQSLQGCQLQLQDHDSREIIDTRPIADSFLESFTIPPATRAYVAAIASDGSEDTFVSDTFVTDGSNEFDEPFVLGEIVLSGN